VIPAALRDYVTGRDPTCRVPGCERTFGLDAHHLIPRILEGDPEQPDGLTWRRVDEAGQGTGVARAS